MPNRLPRWMRPRQYPRSTPVVPREYERSPHHAVAVWCVHDNGRKHLAEPDEGGMFSLPCGRPDTFVLCGTTSAGVCHRLAEHPGRHGNGARTWPNDGPALPQPRFPSPLRHERS